MARNAVFDMLRRKRGPAKNQKKGGAKGSVPLLKESIQLGYVSQDLHPRKSILRRERKLRSNRAVKLSKGTWHQMKIRERKRSIAVNYSEVRIFMSEVFAHLRLGERSQDVTLHQERCARRAAWNLAKNIYKHKNAETASFYSPIEARATPAPTSKSPRENSRSIPELQWTC